MRCASLMVWLMVVFTGCVGADGKDGADGTPGADGADGAPGADGEDGVPGGVADAADIEQEMQAWTKAYLTTQHGRPVKLSTG